jgi:hypothetical protein
MASEIALYYPYIHFQHDAWLKEAVLYWDKVSRIVPEGYAHKLHDSDVVKTLKAEGDIIVDRTPAYETVQAVSEELLAVINQHGDALQAYLTPETCLDGIPVRWPIPSWPSRDSRSTPFRRFETSGARTTRYSSSPTPIWWRCRSSSG